MPGRIDPYLNDQFQVEIDNIADLDFAEVILPVAGAEIVEYREGRDLAGRKLPGTIRYTDLVLRRGVTPSTDLYDWWHKVEDGVPDRRNVAVLLLDSQGNPVKRWVMRGVWPCRYAVSPLIAIGDAATLIEELVCAVETVALA